jgi:hypothetical protein
VGAEGEVDMIAKICQYLDPKMQNVRGVTNGFEKRVLHRRKGEMPRTNRLLVDVLREMIVRESLESMEVTRKERHKMNCGKGRKSSSSLRGGKLYSAYRLVVLVVE